MKLRVHFLPDLVEAAELADSVVVVIDVLRATTTMVHALAAGATEIRPCQDVDVARRIAAECGENVLLGGERGGERIPGFDLGNSPLEYVSDVVKDHTIVFTTTNGTAALKHAEQARQVLVGAFVNLSSVCSELAGSSHIDLLCAGTSGQISREDVLFAGAVASELIKLNSDCEFNDQAELAVDAWRSAVTELISSSLLPAVLRSSHGARNLIEIGHEEDIEIAAQVDRFNIVPEYDGLRVRL